MKAKVLFDLVRSGKCPVVRILEQLWDESWGEKGMLAEVTMASGPDGDGCYSFKFDYNKFRDSNLPLQSHDYWLNDGKKGTAFEAKLMDDKDINEEVMFEDKHGVPVELVDGLVDEYIKSGVKAAYVEWLESQLNSSRNEAERANREREKFLGEIHGVQDSKEVDTLSACPHCGGRIQS